MHKRIILACLLAAIGLSPGQRWEYHIDGSIQENSEWFWCCAVEPDGSGYYGGSHRPTPTDNTFLVVALSSAGAERWVAADSSGSVEDICVGEDGLIYAAGYMYDSEGDPRFAVACFDRWGVQRWVYKALAADGRIGKAQVIRPRPGSGVYVGGYVDLPGRFWEFAVAALDSSGGELWLSIFGSSVMGGEYVADLSVGPDGHIYSCGFLADDQWPAGAVVSLTATGSLRWARFDSLFYPTGICTGTDGNVYVAGASGQQMQPDIAARSFTPDGTSRWSYSYDPGGRGSLDLDHAKDIVWGDGNIYIGGQGCRNDDRIDAFIFSLDSQGGERWQYWFRGRYGWFNWVNKLVFTPDRYVHGAGLTNSLLSEAAAWCLTPDGDTVWVVERPSEGLNSASAQDIACDSAGNVYLAGNRFVTSSDCWAASLSRPQGAPGGNRTDCAYAVAPLADSGYIAAGETHSFGAGNSDGWILRLDRRGDTLWTRTAGGSGIDVLRDVAVADDGGFVGAGELANKPWLVKLGPDGEQVWSHSYAVPHFGRLWAVHALPSGGYVLAGSRYNGANYAYGLVIGTDSAGNELWRTELGEGTNYSYLADIAAGPGGGRLLVGQRKDTPTGQGDLWLVRIDEGGDTLWTRTYGGSQDEWGEAIVPTGDGYWVVGTTRSFGPGSHNIWLLHLTESGDTLRTRTWGRTGKVSRGRDIVVVPGQGYALTGEYENWSGADMLLLETDEYGNELAFQLFGGKLPDQGHGICLGAAGEYCIVGATLSFGTGGSQNAYIVVTSSGVGIAEPHAPEPLPERNYARTPASIVRGVLRLRAGHNPILPGESGLCPKPALLLDISGRKVMELHPGENDIRHLSPGVYFVTTSSITHTVSDFQKVILTR